MGSFDGNRLWGAEIRDVNLSLVTWSDNNRFLLFATGDGRVLIYDNVGAYVVIFGHFGYHLTRAT